ncbi:MAG: hypothetical protein N3C13_02245 [Aquificaceae bacterium]|nr:hypothetical protein [Aquificaceae bacterium]
MRGLLSLLTSLLLLFADFAVATHHHEDHELHVDCSLCLLEQSPTEGSGEKLTVRLRLIFYDLTQRLEKHEPQEKSYTLNTPIRAPPAL